MYHFVITARLKPDRREEVLQILGDGPPFDLQGTSLERHMVFVADDELIFVFEGARADQQVARLLENDDLLARAERIAPHLEGAPAFPREFFSWERVHTVEGLCFGPDPGPGDSDGGARD